MMDTWGSVDATLQIGSTTFPVKLWGFTIEKSDGGYDFYIRDIEHDNVRRTLTRDVHAEGAFKVAVPKDIAEGIGIYNDAK